MKKVGLSVWEAVDSFNVRSTTGRVVVNPPSKRGPVVAHRMPESWYLCNCGRAFSCPKKYVEHKSSHTGFRTSVVVNFKHKPKTKIKLESTTTSFKNYSRVKIKRGLIERFGKICKAKIEPSMVEKLDSCLRSFEENFIKSYTKSHDGSSLGLSSEANYVTAAQIIQRKMRRKATNESQSGSRGHYRNEEISNAAQVIKKPSTLSPKKEFSIKCPKCNKSFEKPVHLLLHTKYKHPAHQNSERQDNDARVPLKESQNEDPALAPQELEVSNNFRCQICLTKCVNRIGLFRHLMVKHKGKGVLHCKLCKYMCSSAKYLELHMKRLHKGTKVTSKIGTRSRVPSYMSWGLHSGAKESAERLSQISAIDGENNVNESHTRENRMEDSKETRSGLFAKKSPRYLCIKCNQRFLNEGTLRRHNRFKHPESFCTKCNGNCDGTCNSTSQKIALSIRTRVQQNLMSRSGVLRSSTKKMTEEVLKSESPSSDKLPEDESGSVQTKDNDVSVGEIEAMVEESVDKWTRSLRSANVESPVTDEAVKESQTCFFQNSESRDMFYDTIGTRTRSKNPLDNELNPEKNPLPARPSVDIEALTCKICGQQKKSQQSLTKHIWWNHSKNRIGNGEESPKIKSESDTMSSINSNCSTDRDMVDPEQDKAIFSKFGSKNVKCAACNKTVRRCFYQKHLRSHTRLKKSLDCDKCDKKFPYPSFLKIHMQQHSIQNFTSHDTLLPVQCDVCGRKFKFSHLLKLHMKAHQPIQNWDCEICGKRFKHQFILESHCLKFHKIKSAQIKLDCGICGKTFSHTKDLWEHVNNQHSANRGKLKCELCHIEFTSRIQFDLHMKSCHVPNGEFSCGECPCVLGSMRALKPHMLRHKRQRMSNRFHSDESVPDPSSSPSFASSTDELPAPTVESEVSPNTRQKNKTASPKNDDSVIITQSEKKNKYLANCEKCGCLISKNHLDHHLSTAHVKFGKFPCSQCNCIFANNNSASAHFRQAHGRRRHVRISSMADVKATLRHRSPVFVKSIRNSKIVEDESKPNTFPSESKWSTCSLCKLLIPGGSHEMAAHRKIAHVKNSEFGCNYCSCAFSDDHGLKVHLSTVIHTSVTQDRSEQVILSPRKSPENKTSPTKQQEENQNQSARYNGPGPFNTQAVLNNVSKVGVRRSMLRLQSPAKSMEKLTTANETVTSSASSTPASSFNTQQLIPGVTKISGKKHFVIKPTIAHSNPEPDEGVPIIVSCYSQNPEYLKKNSPQKTETSGQKKSPIFRSNQQQSHNSGEIKTNTTGIGKTVTSLVWSPPKKTISNARNLAMITSNSSIAIQNLFGNTSARSITCRSSTRISSMKGESVTRKGRSLQPGVEPLPSNSNKLEPPAMNGVFKVPLPPRQSLSRVKVVSPVLTPSPVRLGMIATPPSVSHVNQQRDFGRNNFVFPSLGLKSISDNSVVVNESNIITGNDATANAQQKNTKNINDRSSPTALLNKGIYVRSSIENIHQSPEHRNGLALQPYLISSSSKSQDQQQQLPSSLDINITNSFSLTSFQPNQSIFSDTVQNKIQNQEAWTLTGEEKNTDVSVRTRLVTCNICTKSFFSQAKLSNHMKIHETGSSKELSPQKPGGKCGYCGQAFISHNALWTHLKVCLGPGSPASLLNISASGSI